MGERHGVLRKLPAAAALFLTDDVDANWQEKLSIAGKRSVAGNSAPDQELEEEDNNQEDDAPKDEESDDAKPGLDVHVDNDELHQLRHENASMAQRLELMKAQHAHRIGTLEEKLQQAVATHSEIEQKLRAQLETVLREQQEAVENARKVRKVLSRVSTWVRQVQRAASSQRPPPPAATPASHDLELTMTPRTSAPYSLWTGGASPATNTAKCNEFIQDPFNSFEVTVYSNIKPRGHSLPPPAPGRNRAKAVPSKGFNYVGYDVASPSNRSAEAVTKPTGGVEIVLNGLPSVSTASRRDTPVPKRSPGSLLAYCAQVVTTSLAGVRSSPSPPVKALPAWKSDGLSPVREELDVDEEAGQCYAPVSFRSQHVNVALPNLSIGLL